MTVEFVVKRTGGPFDATIQKEGKTIGNIHFENGFFAVVDDTKEKNYKMTPKVDGEVRPFSMIACEAMNDKEVLKIENNLFWHNGNIYMMNNLPEGKKPRDHITGSRFITKLVNFPYASHKEIDPETWERLGRHRGQQVGEFSGLGSAGGHKVKLADELEDIGIPLASASYLIYSTG